MVDFFDQNEKHTSLLTADIAEIDEKSNNMKARGNVIAISDSGITLFSEILMWDAKEEKLLKEKEMMTKETPQVEEDVEAVSMKKKKSFFEKFTDGLKEFLDNAE